MPHGRATMPAERRRPSSAGAARPICSSERRAPVSRSRTSREQPWQYSSTCFDVPIRWSQQQPSSRPVARRHQTRSSVASWNANPGSFPAATRPQTHHRRGAPRSRPVRDRPLLDESQCRPFAGRALRPPSQVWRFGATIEVVCPSSLFSCQGAAWVAKVFPDSSQTFPKYRSPVVPDYTVRSGAPVLPLVRQPAQRSVAYVAPPLLLSRPCLAVIGPLRSR